MNTRLGLPFYSAVQTLPGTEEEAARQTENRWSRPLPLSSEMGSNHWASTVELLCNVRCLA